MKKGGGQETSSPRSNFAAGERVAGAPRRGAASHEEGGEVRRPAPPAAISLQENGWPEPHGGELPAMKKEGQCLQSASTGVAAGSASPGVAACLALQQDIVWPEPQKGELPAMKKGQEVKRPAPPAAHSLPEIMWLDLQRKELLATKKGGEGQETTPTDSQAVARIALAGGDSLCAVSLAATAVGVRTITGHVITAMVTIWLCVQWDSLGQFRLFN
ncbi:UNVERIFIED_CONTAM: hypothetical protein FKN15_057466 [Acipenser sinensis]